MGENDVVFLENFWGKFAKSVPFFFELFTAFGSRCINSENNWLLLISMGEGVQNSVTLTNICVVVEHMASVSPSSWVWDFVVEKSG